VIYPLELEDASKRDSAFTLAIIIVNFRTSELVVDCLASLMHPGTTPADTRVVVVDGNSGDHSVEYIRAAIARNFWGARAEVLALDVNGGFAYANNRGIDHAKNNLGTFRHCLLLNPDTIARPNSVTHLVEFMEENPDAGIAGSRLEDPDGTGQACAFRFPSIACEFESEARIGPITRLLYRWRGVPDMHEGPNRIDWVSGASMLVRAEVMDDIGCMDERFFLYYEETDFCLRAARAGWSCWHIPKSRVVHLVGQATGVTNRERPARRPRYWFDSRRYFYLKNHGRVYLAMVNAAWLCGHLLWRVRLVLERKRPNNPPHLLSDFVRHLLPG
jgi:N-acetylglucosaminyl-diphospho-decaprenol L-rhamnosyltransferase